MKIGDGVEGVGGDPSDTTHTDQLLDEERKKKASVTRCGTMGK